MRDKGLDKGFIRYFDDSKREQKGWGANFFGFRKMFRDYLKKLHVIFYDECCPEASENVNIVPSGFNILTGLPVYWDAVTETWLAQQDWITTTTTTSTTTSTTAPTTTTTSTTTTTTTP